MKKKSLKKLIKNIVAIFLNHRNYFLFALLIVTSCKEKFPGWKKTENGYEKMKNVEGFPFYLLLKAKEDTLNVAYEIRYKRNNSLYMTGNLKNGKYYGNTYRFNAEKDTIRYDFMTDECEKCGDLPSTLFGIEYDKDGVADLDSRFGSLIIKADINTKKIKLNNDFIYNIFTCNSTKIYGRTYNLRRK
ncbi:hypothetical protein [Aureivirga marina]|uniref:hypothetical protein n=1 Tax=Aureivirga marina TaxID=1182451 RepID=UPI0018CB625B|nr:hypothetical protein [Aureivirga marina]